MAERFPQRTDGTGPGAPQEKCGVNPALTEMERTALAVNKGGTAGEISVPCESRRMRFFRRLFFFSQEIPSLA